jgi:hypothetical protein
VEIVRTMLVENPLPILFERTPFVLCSRDNSKGHNIVNAAISLIAAIEKASKDHEQ